MQSARPSCLLWEVPSSELELGIKEDATSSMSQLTAAALAALDASAAAAASLDDESAAAAARTCKTCGTVEADSAEDWRAHFRSDWHRFNLQRRAAGRPVLGEPEFAALVDAGGEDVGSISGSESPSEGSEDGEQRPGASSTRQQQRTPHFVFGPPGGRRLAVWRALVAPEPPEASARAAAPPASPQECLNALRALRSTTDEQRFAVILLRGGHFAAAIFSLQPSRVANPRLSEKERFALLGNKSAHRYVARAGQGGKQSAKDASGKYAKSAGSRLRRYNEGALRRDVEEGLLELGPLLASCHLLFLHAPGSNGQQLLGGEAPPLDRADPRLRRVPFTTRRPTLSEAQRVMRLLVSVWSLEEVQQQAAEAAEAAGAVAEHGSAESAAAAAAAAAERARREQQRAEAASKAAAAAAAQAAAEEAARLKRAEKKARQKAVKDEQRRAAARQEDAAAGHDAAAAAAAPAEDDLISAAAAQVAAASSKLEAKPAKVSGGGAGSAGRGQAKASGAGAAALAAPSWPKPGEDAALRRARMAAAAEARAKALEAAMAAQKLH